MPRFAAYLSYDGTDFHGYARQPNLITVQGELEKAISTVANHPVDITCAGRTDAGVHALEQVIHFDSDAERTPFQWQAGINGNLPKTIRVHRVEQVSDDFHARFSAKARRYQYKLYCASFDTAIGYQYHTLQRKLVDVKAMQAAADVLIGEHDFSSFRAADCQAKHAVREIQHLQLTQAGDYILVDIQANAFVHHMVRNIVGALLWVGEGNADATWMQELLARQDRSQAPRMAPASGLFLVAVMY